MAKYERTLTGDFQEVLSFLERTIQASGGFLHFVDGTDCDLGNTRIAVRVYDRYYMRNNSRASLTLTVVGWKHRDRFCDRRRWWNRDAFPFGLGYGGRHRPDCGTEPRAFLTRNLP